MSASTSLPRFATDSRRLGSFSACFSELKAEDLLGFGFAFAFDLLPDLPLLVRLKLWARIALVALSLEEEVREGLRTAAGVGLSEERRGLDWGGGGPAGWGCWLS